MLTSATSGRQQTGQQRARQRRGVHLGKHAVIEHFDLLDRVFSHLTGKAAEHFGKLDNRFEAPALLPPKSTAC